MPDYIKIDELPATIAPHRDMEFPVMKDGLTKKVKISQAFETLTPADVKPSVNGVGGVAFINWLTCI